MDDGQVKMSSLIRKGSEGGKEWTKEDNVGSVALLLDLVVAPSSRESTIH